jgi:hypothetical protein
VILSVYLGNDSADVSGFNATSQFSKKVPLYAAILRSFFIYNSYCNVQYNTIQYNTIYLYVCRYTLQDDGRIFRREFNDALK